MARTKRGRRAYATDLSETQWALIAPLIPEAEPGGRPRKTTSRGAKGVLKRSRSRFPFVELAYVDGGYAGRLVRWAKDRTHIVLEVVKRSAEQVGFAVIRRRWVVERTFAWIVKNRRLVRDYEQLTAVAETLITVAAIGTLIRRWP